MQNWQTPQHNIKSVKEEEDKNIPYILSDEIRQRN
jgi:hypothetical protein